MTSSEKIMDTVKSKQDLRAMDDDMHRLFKKKDINLMDKYMSKDGIYMGTDPNEIFNYNDLRNYFDKFFKDTASKLSDYTISHKNVSVHGPSAVIINQYILPDISKKVMVRNIGHARFENGNWIIDMYSWNLISKNADIPKINKAL